MEKKIKVGLRFKLLYIIFAICSLAGIFFGTTSRSIFASINEYSRLEATPDIDYNYSDFIYSVTLAPRYEDFATPIAVADTTLRVSSRPSMIDLRIEADSENSYAGNIWAFILNYAVMAVALICYAILLAMIISLAKSIRRKTFFSRRNIHRVRWVGCLQIAYSLLYSLYVWVDNHTAAALLRDSGLNVDTSFTPEFGQIIAGLMILFIGEIFAIGYDLSEEQKLTI